MTHELTNLRRLDRAEKHAVVHTVVNIRTPAMLRTIVLVFASTLTVSVAAAQPRLQMPLVHDWGTVTASNSTAEVQSVKAVVPITNAGTSPLTIKEVRTSCGCTSAPLDKDSLAPGESTNLNVTLNLPGGNGPVEKYITIITNEPESKPHILTIKANVQRALQLSSSYIPFNVGLVNTPHIGTLTITSNNETPVTVTASTEMVTLTIEPDTSFTLKKGESRVLTFTYVPDAVGSYSVRALLRTDLAGYDVISLQGFGSASAKEGDPAPTFMRIGE